MDTFLKNFPSVPCRVLLWSHKNGYFDPPLPDVLVDACDGLLVTTPYTLENPRWQKNGALVYGFGDFDPASLPHKTSYAPREDRFTVGYVGMPGYKRFPRDCMDYFTAAIQQVPTCHFVMVGEVSDDFIEETQRRGMGGYFTFLGWVSGVQNLLLTFDVFGYLLRPDIFATTENSVLEAMAAALPVLISRVPLGKYLVDDRISGLLFESPEEYGAILRELWESEPLRRQLGEKAREHVITRCRADENTARFHEACRKTAMRPRYIHNFERGATE